MRGVGACLHVTTDIVVGHSLLPPRASQLAPSDARMWCAMGQCYASEHLGQVENAIRCYRRAVQHGDREGIALHKLVRVCVRDRALPAQCEHTNLR